MIAIMMIGGAADGVARDVDKILYLNIQIASYGAVDKERGFVATIRCRVLAGAKFSTSPFITKK